MVDTKYSFPNGKCKRQDSIASNSDDVIEDESLLKQPLWTSCAGFKEAKKAYENGTDEVRRLLMQECSLIYECNVCRNMFRSLANFISHKRNYCKSTTANNFHSLPDCSSSMLIQTVERSKHFPVKSRSTGSSPVPNPKSSSRDLNRVIERLKRVEVSSECANNKSLVVDFKPKVFSLEPKAPNSVLELESVSATTQAVYQTLKKEHDSDSIKTELEEVHNLLTNKKILLGPDGKVISSPEIIPFSLSAVNNDKSLAESNYEDTQLLPWISCEICKKQFQTEKTLKMHVQKNHTSTTYVFQCPTCSMTFLQPAAVIRHLANEHKKPLRRIRKMRDTILKKRIQIGDVQVKGLGREVKSLQMNNTKDLCGSNIAEQQNGISITSCTYCLKNFERRAALATHLASCLARKHSLNSTEISKKVSISNEQNNKTKSQNEISEQLLRHNNKNDEFFNGGRAESKINIKQEPLEDLNTTTNSSNINKLFENLENQTFGVGLQTLCLEKIQLMADLNEKCNEKEKEKPMEEYNKSYNGCGDQNNENDVKINNVINRSVPAKKEKTKRFRIVSSSKLLTCRCKICNKQFNALSNLRRHISMFHYRSRRFGCKLCDYRAFRRYDIVNHLTFVHKMTGERESMAVEFVTVHEIKYSKDDVEGDIVVVNDGDALSEQKNTKKQKLVAEESESFACETSLKTYEKECSKKVLLQSNKDTLHVNKIDTITSKDKFNAKVVRRKFKKSLEQQVEGKKRPIRNRIKTVNKDFVYDLLTLKEDPKPISRLMLKRANTLLDDQNSLRNIELSPPPIKITPYRLRTEPLIPVNKSSVKGVAATLSLNAIHEGLASPSTLPELPAERPQMRNRLKSSSRSDSTTVPVIGTSELEAAGLKSTFFDDSFLEKFAKKSNPSFKMKPLTLQHSPLDSILQKFDASQQSNSNRTDNNVFQKPFEKDNISIPNYNECLVQNLTQSSLKETDFTPNGKQIIEPSSPPATPKKRITLMQRLAENRAKRKDSVIRAALEN